MPQRIRLPDQNQVIIVGRVAQDLDLKYTQKGQAVCRFNVALNRSYKDSSGVWQKEVSYIPVVAWRDVATRCSERLKKGSPVYVMGRLRTHSWDDKAGQKRKSVEVEIFRIQFLEVKGDEPEQETPVEEMEDAANNQETPPGVKDAVKEEDEVPF